MSAEDQCYRLVVVQARVVVQAVDAERVLAQPDADQLVQQDLVVWQGDAVRLMAWCRLRAIRPALAAVNGNPVTFTPAARASCSIRTARCGSTTALARYSRASDISVSRTSPRSTGALLVSCQRATRSSATMRPAGVSSECIAARTVRSFTMPTSRHAS